MNRERGLLNMQQNNDTFLSNYVKSFLDCVFFIPSLSRLCDKDRYKKSLMAVPLYVKSIQKTFGLSKSKLQLLGWLNH
jgi:hypothetical protein